MKNVSHAVWLSVREEDHARSWFNLLDQNLLTLRTLEEGHCHSPVPQPAGSMTALCF